jgi:hypothetical protein
MLCWVVESRFVTRACRIQLHIRRKHTLYTLMQSSAFVCIPSRRTFAGMYSRLEMDGSLQE